MSPIGRIYKCSLCGNIVQLMHYGSGVLVCCGQPMKLMTANTVDASKEKHVPIVTQVDGGFKVTVGSTIHPMEEKHYIQWIELLADGQFLRKHLQAGDEPQAVFLTSAGEVSARAFCNLHGNWQSD